MTFAGACRLWILTRLRQRPLASSWTAESTSWNMASSARFLQLGLSTSPWYLHHHPSWPPPLGVHCWWFVKHCESSKFDDRWQSLIRPKPNSSLVFNDSYQPLSTSITILSLQCVQPVDLAVGNLIRFFTRSITGWCFNSWKPNQFETHDQLDSQSVDLNSYPFDSSLTMWHWSAQTTAVVFNGGNPGAGVAQPFTAMLKSGNLETQRWKDGWSGEWYGT